MLLWLRENIATCIVGLVLLLSVIVVLRQLVRDFKSGKPSCGGGCSGCPMQGSCHDTPKSSK